MKYGREMGFTSHQVKTFYKELKSNPSSHPNLILCKVVGCRGGFRINNITNKLEECPTCKGYGFTRKN